MQHKLGVLIAAGLAAAVLGSPATAQAAGTITAGGNPPNCIFFGVICKANKVVFLFDPDAKFFNLQPCTCGTTKLTVCDPEATSGTSTSSTVPTIPACVGNAALTEVPTQVEAVKNPGTFFCTTIGGKRTCYDRRP